MLATMRPSPFSRAGFRRALSLAATLWLLVCTQPWPALGFTADPEKDLPFLDKLEIFQPGEPSILYSDRDEAFASLAPEFRILAPLDRIPKLMQQAVLDNREAELP